MKQNQQQPFGNDFGPDNTPMTDQGIVRDKPISDVGKNITRRAQRQSRLVKTSNPYAGFTNHPDLDNLLGG